MNSPIERCPKCNGVLAIIGRVHLCRPVPVAGPMESSSAVEQAAVNRQVAGSTPASPATTKPKRSREPLLAHGAGPAPAKKSYAGYKDADARRAYQRELMRKRRAKV